jgi:uncharacterized membrane protein YgdD (TMEM256/DUF423 family)
MNWGAIGATLAGIAVLIGAFGAHALRDRLDAYATRIYERAAFYQFVHALGLIALGAALAAGAAAGSAAALAGWLLFAGAILFCGSLYALALSGIRKFGAIAPFGGLALIAGWFAFAYALGAGK